ncbi:hypothetical protein SAMD00019534_026740 [Acytostelium subglobosum LB1]|uniref:hypothetical protein n=1 Tax=Acytostelium subglobosum LB1 TaxID=1410327 RepID=UPI000644DEDE|nr:hypothetical protein SAMD00019534_026740 [Acytostelium subglobosum LB1]GAM19499.1 hypothetical protein SAMD00019534_026740 [Acytostelium subglobosum LB1]|eukprot:XP_012757426.1 hypothetical protein SAMD00019534_026740 [Acytostelium subglobosum LB1]
MNRTTVPKRKTSERACFLCQKDNVTCDEKTPCSRCVERGAPQMCYYTHFDRPVKQTGTTSSGGVAVANNNTANNNTNPFVQSKNTQPFTYTGSDIIKYPVSSRRLINNDFIMNELRDLKEGQKKIYDELLYLREKNKKLELVNESLLSKLSYLNINSAVPAMPAPGTVNPTFNIDGDHAISFPRNIKEIVDYYQNIFIVFDTSKNPPTVIEASKNFCKFLGYTQNEIIGLPWTQIIHPANIEVTMNLFNRNFIGSSVEIPQLYRHKNGAAIFSTIDNHTFIFGSEGRPICDVVNIKLISPDILPTDLFYPSGRQQKKIMNKPSISIDQSTPPDTPIIDSHSTGRIYEAPSTPMVDGSSSQPTTPMDTHMNSSNNTSSSAHVYTPTKTHHDPNSNRINMHPMTTTTTTTQTTPNNNIMFNNHPPPPVSISQDSPIFTPTLESTTTPPTPHQQQLQQHQLHMADTGNNINNNIVGMGNSFENIYNHFPNMSDFPAQMSYPDLVDIDSNHFFGNPSGGVGTIQDGSNDGTSNLLNLDWANNSNNNIINVPNTSASDHQFYMNTPTSLDHVDLQQHLQNPPGQ